MSTWHQIYLVGPPVVGRVEQYESAVAEFQERHAAARRIVQEFGRVNSAGVSGRLEGEVGTVFGRITDEVDHGLEDLPRVSQAAHDVLATHLEALRSLHTEVEEALARATSSWREHQRLEAERPDLERRVRQLTDQIRSAGPDDDTSALERSLTGAERIRSANAEAIASEQRTLQDIYAGPYQDSVWRSLQAREWELESDTAAALDRIDLGELRDPSWFQSLVGALADFALGILESVANLLEAFLTGDWATFFWELRNVLNAALLILGTIALFTGVGAILFIVSAFAFAVTLGLFLSETPNPQTGQTIGLGDVLIAGVGVALSAGGAFRQMWPTGQFSVRAPVQSIRGLGAPNLAPNLGFANGGLASTARNLRNIRLLGSGGEASYRASQGLSIRYATIDAPGGFFRTYVFDARNAYTTARVAFGTRGTVGRVQNLTDVSLGPLDSLTGAKGHPAIAGASGGAPTFDVTGYRVQLGSPGGLGSPLFAPAASPARTQPVISQMAESPQVHVVPVATP